MEWKLAKTKIKLMCNKEEKKKKKKNKKKKKKKKQSRSGITIGNETLQEGNEC